MWAITKGSLRAMLRSPSAIIFTFLFPFIFILVFGFIGNSGGVPVYKVVLAPGSDTANAFYDSLKASNRLNFIHFANQEEMKLESAKGKFAGILSIKKTGQESPAYEFGLKSTNASSDQWPQLREFLNSIAGKVSNSIYANRPSYARLNFDYNRDITVVREYKTIDFILPGQLGFSLLSAGVFGVAFMFYSLRNTLVLKRMYATPIKRAFIVLGEALSRVIFQMITAIVIIGVGYFFFGFTLIHGWITALEMLFLSFIGLLVFMGFGFIISGLAKSDSSIAPFANLITLPQFLLAGTFFSIEVFPSWLQPISRALPLTHLNNALRAVAFEGQNLWQVKAEIGILLIWGIVAYAIAVKVFRWE